MHKTPIETLRYILVEMERTLSPSSRLDIQVKSKPDFDQVRTPIIKIKIKCQLAESYMDRGRDS
jgi:hypothetical protein